MEFHTRGLGSSDACNSRASREMAFRSDTRPEQAGQELRCSSCSALRPPSIISARTRSNSAHFILPLSPIPLFLCSSRLSGLFGSARFEELAQLHPCLV